MMARKVGAKREVVGAVSMNLHLSGLAMALDSLPAAIDGHEQMDRSEWPGDRGTSIVPLSMTRKGGTHHPVAQLKVMTRNMRSPNARTQMMGWRRFKLRANQ
jgi:hypothetical protein